MYPSDYAYTYANGVDNTCFTNGIGCDGGNPKAGWLYNNELQWTLTPYIELSYDVYNIYPNGLVGSYSVYYPNGARPTVFLSSEIKITGGDGSSGNPYTLG